MSAKIFDRSLLLVLPLNLRKHLLFIDIISNLTPVALENIPIELIEIGKKIVKAKQKGGSIIFMMGAHVIRSGVQRYIIDLMKKGYVSCIAMNGAGVIHDFELSLIGATTESVEKYIEKGQFGLWKETGFINDIVNEAYEKDSNSGFGESIGRAILKGDYPFKEFSLFANAIRYQALASVHIGIGYDIIHEHPNFNGAASGALSYNDFLKFTSIIEKLENGVVMNFGSSVMAPEIYLKALSMARNTAKQKGNHIKRFSSLVCDLHEINKDFSNDPPNTCASYYFRPYKTMLVRTVKDGGKSYYVCGKHINTIPALWTAINEEENRQDKSLLT